MCIYIYVYIIHKVPPQLFSYLYILCIIYIYIYICIYTHVWQASIFNRGVCGQGFAAKRPLPICPLRKVQFLKPQSGKWPCLFLVDSHEFKARHVKARASHPRPARRLRGPGPGPGLMIHDMIMQLHVYVYKNMCIYIYIERERERDSQREREIIHSVNYMCYILYYDVVVSRCSPEASRSGARACNI